MDAFEAAGEAAQNLPGGLRRVIETMIRLLAEADPGFTFRPLLSSGRRRLAGTFP